MYGEPEILNKSRSKWYTFWYASEHSMRQTVKVEIREKLIGMTITIAPCDRNIPRYRRKAHAWNCMDSFRLDLRSQVLILYFVCMAAEKKEEHETRNMKIKQ